MKYIIILFSLVSLACVSTLSAPANAALVSENLPKAANSELENAPKEQTYTLGKVYVRECASTSCAVVGSFEAGALVTLATDKIATPIVIDCPAWYGVEWRGGVSFVCAGWVAK